MREKIYWSGLYIFVIPSDSRSEERFDESTYQLTSTTTNYTYNLPYYKKKERREDQAFLKGSEKNILELQLNLPIFTTLPVLLLPPQPDILLLTTQPTTYFTSERMVHFRCRAKISGTQRKYEVT